MLIDYTYGKVIFVLFMLLCAIEDIRKECIDVRIFVAEAFLCIGGYVWMRLTNKEILWLRIGIGLLVGAILWLISIATKEQIGYGDAMYFTLTGMILACKNVLFFLATIFLSAILSLIYCIVSKIKKKRIKNKAFPLLPIALPIGLVVMIFV